MSGKTYGAVGHATTPSGRNVYMLELEPDVMIRAKRLFPRVETTAVGKVLLEDTPETSTDIVWLMQRFPLLMTPEVEAQINAQHARYVEQQTAVHEILTGTRRLDWPSEPAIPPRDYQIVGADMWRTTKGVLIGDEVGLGKTFTSLLMLRDPQALPALVVVPTHLPAQWLRRMNEYLPWLTGHVITKGSPMLNTAQGRKPYPIPDGTDVLFTSYSKLPGWRDHLAGSVRTVIFDEVQELRTGTGTAKYDAAKHIAGKAEYVAGLSATPIYNYGGETWSIFDVIKPDALGTKSEFAREWGGDKVKDPKALGNHLRSEGLLIRRTRIEVGRELPAPVEEIVEVASDGHEIDRVVGDMVSLAERLLHSKDSNERFTASGQFDLKMRQATGIDKAPQVADFVQGLLESQSKVAVMGWHRTVYDIWLNRLVDFNPVMYTGSESAPKKDRAAQRFIDDPECRVFICSLRSGAGLDGLQDVCSDVVFGELDWSPAMHHQVIGRFARDGQPNSVAAFYCLSEEGSDPYMRGVLEDKTQQAEGIMAPGGDDQRLFTAIEGKGDRVRAMAESVLKRAGLA